MRAIVAHCPKNANGYLCATRRECLGLLAKNASSGAPVTAGVIAESSKKDDFGFNGWKLTAVILPDS